MSRSLGLLGVLATTVAIAIGSNPTAASRLRQRQDWVGVSVPSSRAWVGSQVDGAISRVAVREGDEVKQGALLIQLKHDIPSIEVGRLHARAAQDIGVRDAHKRLQLLEARLNRAEQLAAQDIASGQDIDTLRAKRDLGKLHLEQAELDRKLLQFDLRDAEAKLAQYQIVSPFDGVVNSLTMCKGDSIERLKPVVDVICIDPLWVEFSCTLDHLSEFAIGTTVEVQCLEPASDVRTATVIHHSVSADTASQTKRIRLEVGNSDHTWYPGRKLAIRAPASQPDVATPPKPGGK